MYVANPPFSSVADVAYLLMYSAVYVSLMLLIRSRLRNAGIAAWLDGGVVALTTGAVASALVFSIVPATTHGAFVDELVNVAYPVGDFMLLMFVACAFSLASWRPGWAWLLIGLGLIATATADLMYVSAVAKGSAVTSDLLNGLYLLSMSLMAAAAWAPDRRGTVRRHEAPQTVVLTSPAAAGALALLVTVAFHRLNPLAVALAAGALVLTGVRAALTYLENVRAIRRSGREASTDALSGLGNRRALMDDRADAIQARERPDAARRLRRDRRVREPQQRPGHAGERSGQDGMRDLPGPERRLDPHDPVWQYDLPWHDRAVAQSMTAQPGTG